MPCSPHPCCRTLPREQMSVQRHTGQEDALLAWRIREKVVVGGVEVRRSLSESGELTNVTRLAPPKHLVCPNDGTARALHRRDVFVWLVDAFKQQTKPLCACKTAAPACSTASGKSWTCSVCTLWVKVSHSRSLAATCSGGVHRRGARANTAVLTRTVVVRGCRDWGTQAQGVP